MKFSSILLAAVICLLGFSPLAAQKNSEGSKLAQHNFSAFKFRNIGPAATSGRIADIAFHPEDPNTWYVAVGSGGVWKTENAGTTWKPIFDNQPVYSIGCITVDSKKPNRVWVGTGENVGGRHVGFGDGIYLSEDGGKSWSNMGLQESEHISKILVHPENSNVVYVAAQGPLWNKGGQRGFYYTEDGGKNWTRTLGDDEWTGVTDILMDPRNPEVLFAATWQKHRTVAAYYGGGPNSGIHKSTDGGKTWTELKNGIPGGNKGKIGLAMSPQNPDYVYAAIEQNRREGGVYLSTNGGASWTRMSDVVSGATGPHYYQELYASPHKFGAIYLVDVRMQVSYDHGKTFEQLPTGPTHSDSHSLNFHPTDPDYLLLGTDGGIYETLDYCKTWRYIKNLPVTQYYKVAVDDAEPFYNVFGGTQDNGSHGGPSRTDDANGIRNAHWSRVLGGDGHQSATEPGNPNIGYAESQQGYLNRLDRITGEAVFIQPQPAAGEDEERFNWDAPILVSAHDPATIYFASHRVWKSTNRGDSWEAVSGDLTKDLDRLTQPIMGRTQSWDGPWDVYAMSNYSTITSIGESPINADVLYAGSDDGLIHATTDGGENWMKIDLANIKGVPATAFVNDIRADLYDEATVYAVLDNHKYGDFKPYLIKSTNYGKSWSSISSNLPEKLLLWRIVQDHINPDLFFLATEFGAYFTVNGGDEWIKLEGGMPTISLRDITIQRRENDVVAASFGRGFFILDDYSPLRELSDAVLDEEATLFKPRDGYWYVPKNTVSYMGDDYYSAPNPDFGVTFSYYLKESIPTKKAERQKAEKALGDADIPFPGWDTLEDEMREKPASLHIEIFNEAGMMVQRVPAKQSKGFHRVSWDLSMANQGMVSADNPNRGSRRGFMAQPGMFSAQLMRTVDGTSEPLGYKVTFEVKPLYEKPALDRKEKQEVMAFRQQVEAFANMLTKASNHLVEGIKKAKAMQVALSRSRTPDPALMKEIHDLEMALYDIESEMNGNLAKREVREVMPPTPRDRMFVAYRGLMGTYGPTEMHKQSLAAGKQEFEMIHEKLHPLMHETMPALMERLKENGAPPISE